MTQQSAVRPSPMVDGSTSTLAVPPAAQSTAFTVPKAPQIQIILAKLVIALKTQPHGPCATTAPSATKTPPPAHSRFAPQASVEQLTMRSALLASPARPAPATVRTTARRRLSLLQAV